MTSSTDIHICKICASQARTKNMKKGLPALFDYVQRVNSDWNTIVVCLQVKHRIWGGVGWKWKDSDEKKPLSSIELDKIKCNLRQLQPVLPRNSDVSEFQRNCLKPSHPGFSSGFWANWNWACCAAWGLVSFEVFPSPPAIILSSSSSWAGQFHNVSVEDGSASRVARGLMR